MHEASGLKWCSDCDVPWKWQWRLNHPALLYLWQYEALSLTSVSRFSAIPAGFFARRQKHKTLRIRILPDVRERKTERLPLLTIQGFSGFCLAPTRLVDLVAMDTRRCARSGRAFVASFLHCRHLRSKLASARRRLWRVRWPDVTENHCDAQSQRSEEELRESFAKYRSRLALLLVKQAWSAFSV